jgi:small subunit ribosomal protein S7e
MFGVCRSELRPLQISAAREVEVKGGKKAIVIFVPVPQLKAFHKIQQRSIQLRRRVLRG